MLRFLQNQPRFYERAYQLALALLRPFRRWMVPGGWVERFFVSAERVSKGALFDCRMCGMCILHHTGMTCPMTCPKNLRNGPCGGVRPDGNCEILPDQPCIWVLAWQRSRKMSTFGDTILYIQPPVNYQLQDSSAWINDLSLQENMLPNGWE